LILSDMDGTIVRNGSSCYRSAMEEAIYEVFQKQTLADWEGIHGSTDRQIIENILKKHYIPFDNKSLDRVIYTFGQVYPEIPPDIELIPGVLETIPILWQDHQLGLVTGNVEVIARKRLRKFRANGISLSDYFAFGGFGSDPHEQRADLVTLAIQRARLNYGWKDNNLVYVVDDTPRGIEAALIAGVKPIGITTGIFSERELRAAGANLVVANYTKIPAIVQ
jgi:phosphoglycolate phosphatase